MVRPSIRKEIRFLLNGETVTLQDVAADATLLDWLRLTRRLTGTKEGCAEGDCGACTVLVGRLAGDGLVYESVNACIRFLGSLDGCHVVTVEHLKGRDGALHPVQRAMVDLHGSQCGFCTPGFVMSLYALWMRDPNPGDAAIETALQGNLCRCTGYEPIVRAAKAAAKAGGQDRDRLVAERAETIAKLAAFRDGARVECGGVLVPASLDDFAALLSELPDATVVAGATDVGLWVTKRFRAIAPALFIGGLGELKTVTESGGVLTIGAGVSYSDAREALAARIPALARLIDRVGGEQVRNMGTIGGNIANGSPIGDMPPALIALGANLVLRKGAKRRRMPLESFFIAYGKQDRRAGEFVEAVEVPIPAADTIVAFHKVSKRRDEDITSTLGAFAIAIAEGTVRSARIAYGGMAATPKRAPAVEAALEGRSWSRSTVESAMEEYIKDFSPISDMRASAGYRMIAARNLLLRTFLEATSGGKPVSLRRHEAA